MKKLTQDQKILNHLEKIGSITSWDAIYKYRATRLSAIINRLKKIVAIEDVWESNINEEGELKNYKRYSLKK